MQLILLQRCTIILLYHDISLCEKEYGGGHPYWKAGDYL
jgi:hypothetical protein